MRFVDTNILLYAVGKDPRVAKKTAAALDILHASDLAFSVQVFQEFYFQATRSQKPDRLNPDETLALIETWVRFPVQEMTVEIVRAAIHCATRYQLSYWDAAIIEAAKKLNCREVLSEDLNHGQDYGGVRVTNPFKQKSARRRH